ncbi:heparinase II/III domain-containing protein [Zhihengliuella salsuginis]|uniref:heparinase II/III domain-containing protein n=1 Tax=Zhihengliuella salsuginis TaxID=578222 RepID=UPI001678079B|nr:heparinase II/III family protein [Zhihengliuella salsuginis]
MGASSDSAVEAYLTGGVIRSPRFGDLTYDGGRVWDDVGDRTRDRFTHGFLFLADWASVLEAPEQRVRAAVLELIGRWVESAGLQPESARHPMAYHDETTAQRLMHWLLVEWNLRRGGVSDLAPLREAIDATAAILRREDFHAGWNNHGMFQDLALRHYSEMATWNDAGVLEATRQVALRRLHDYFSTCFTADGVHVENSPTYHQMVCQYLGEHSVYLHQRGDTDSELDAILAKAARYAAHVVTPTGRYPLLSDSVARDLRGLAGRIFDDAGFDFSVSGGRRGREPAERTLLLPASGYAIHRSAWADPQATWVMTTAAYNSDYHKHSDDLSVVVHSLGQPLLTEAGPYGYNYADPLTVYAFSQYAHNNIVLDGRSVRRVDTRAETVRMSAAETTDAGFEVTSETGRLPDGHHQRQVSVATGDDADVVRIVDTVESTADRTRTWEQFWNLAANLEVVPHGQGFEAFRDGVKVLDALFTADVPTRVTVHRGESGERPLGWSFPEFGKVEPANVVRVEFAAARARVETRFAVRGDFNYADLALVDGKNQWQRSSTVPPLNYRLEAVEQPADAPLVVVFSAISPKGHFTYNYKNSLQDLHVNVLYILDDFGDQGSYYLQDHGRTQIADAVQRVIAETADRLGVSRRSVYCIGSSKGGTAAIYHGIEFGAGGIVVGAPQTRIGSFLEKPHPNVLEFMTGGTGPGDVEQLDSVLFDQLPRHRDIPAVDLIVGDADHHYRNHVLPWVDQAREAGHEVRLEVVPGTPHAEVGPVFKDFLRSRIGAVSEVRRPDSARPRPDEPAPPEAKTPSGDESPVGLRLDVEPDGPGLRLRVDGAAGRQIAVKLYRDADVVEETGYGNGTEFVWDGLPAGKYRARVYSRTRGGPATGQTTPWCRIP